MHSLPAAPVGPDRHGGGKRDARFLADGSLRICQQPLPNVRVQGGPVDHLPQPIVATSPDILLRSTVRKRTRNRYVAVTEQSPCNRRFRSDCSARSWNECGTSAKYRFLVASIARRDVGVVSRPSAPFARPAHARDRRAPWWASYPLPGISGETAHEQQRHHPTIEAEDDEIVRQASDEGEQ